MSSLTRLSFFYVAIYLGTGVSLPYIATYLRDCGMSGAAIGLILAIPMLAKPFTGPALAVWADGFTLRRSPMVLLSLGAGLGYAALLIAPGALGLAVAWFIGQTLLSTVSPLLDVIALRRARSEGFNYGLPRGTGSAAFIVANLIMGVVLTFVASAIIPIWIALAALLAALAAGVFVPPERVHAEGAKPVGAERWKGVGLLLRNRTFLLAVTTAGLIQGAHAFYYGFSTIIWREQGISDPIIGGLWGVGVAAEVAFMWFLEPWRRKVGPEKLMILGGVAAVLRWIAYAFTPPLWLLFPLQALHAFTFAASFLASLRLIEKLTPPSHASSAQAMNSALSMGFALGVATWFSGHLFDAFGSYSYLAMAGVAALGLAGAIILNHRTGGRGPS
ncbi:MFS transporter [Caulobacter sp. DWR1-3-2b1]|uniref:MFS transporter n=1 Tax=Caulobacter sp. DWR1-3-2b1 TaxID=2804670 RepID=UPI003CF2CBDD